MALIELKNKTTGRVDKVPDNYLDHPVFGKNYERTTELAPCYDCGPTTDPIVLDLTPEVVDTVVKKIDKRDKDNK